jgi:uncharacterized protein (DUF305 family)
MKKSIVICLALLTAVIVAGCGGDEESTAGGSVAGNSTDRAFVADMIPHHESAIEMAEIAQKRGESDFVKSLADDIVQSQSTEIETLRAEDSELADAGVDVGDLGMDMSMEMDTAELETAEPFDPAFIEMMVPHHEDAVEMAKMELEEGEDPELKALAEEIITEQEREIAEMTDFNGGTVESSGGHSMG